MIQARLPSFALGVLALASACGSGGAGNGGHGDCSDLLTGDLVITEVMANPTGEDQGNEYFEIYNATDRTLDLAGLDLEIAREDGSDAKRLALSETIVAPGQYFVFGNVVPEFRPAWIDHGYGNSLGALRNGGGRIALRCGGDEIDAHVYVAMSDGVSQGLDGNIVPDHLANDDAANLCEATTEFATDAFGSPGVANEPCSIVDQGTCLDGREEREVVKPNVGEIVITEVMPDPSAANDAVGEWFEVTALGNFDLNGLVAGEVAGQPKVNLVSEECLTVSPGTRIVFARSDDPLENGGLAVVDATFSFGMSNSGDSLFVGTGSIVLDQVSWSSAPAGASLALAPAHTTPEGNDVADNWCAGSVPYGDGDLGTPGEENLPCELAGMCRDGDDFRPAVAPQEGDLVLTEIMADPDAVGDTQGEWFEVRVDAAIDLNGLQVGKDGALGYTIDVVDCLPVAAGTHVVFARNGDPAVNGGLPTENLFAAGIALTNSGGTLNVGHGDAVFESETYAGSSAGVADSRDPAGEPWCDAVDPYGDGDLGTPGAANPQCP